MDARAKARQAKQRFKAELRRVEKEIKEKQAAFSRKPTEDEFNSHYKKGVLEPPYRFDLLETLHEESDILQTCIDTNVCNIVSFGYDFQLKEKEKDAKKDDPEYQRDLVKAENFFEFPNDEQEWIDIAELEWQDYESFGNGATEYLRNMKDIPQVVYHHPTKDLRLVRLESQDKFRVPATVPRDGKDVTFVVRKTFRRFVSIDPDNSKKLRYYKSFGDPRPLDATTGEYKNSASECKLEASEIFWRKRNFGGQPYGLPRWIGAAFEVAGRRNAQFINYDLGENQGIPNLVLSIIGGFLSEEGYDQLLNIFRGARGVKNFNRLMVLDIEPILGQMGKAASDPKIEWKDLGEARKDDIMFKDYLPQTKENIRMSFRHPPLFTGDAGAYTYAVAYASRLVGEEQVFMPERARNDRRINRKLLYDELGVKYWKYKSRGTAVVGAEEIRKSLQVFADIGALSINHAIRLANKALGETMSLYDDEWANIPIMAVKEMLRQGGTLGKNPPLNQQQAETIIQKNYAMRKALQKSSLSEDEKKAYLALKKVQSIADDLVGSDHESTAH